MRRFLAIALLALAAATGLPATAHAGGPTSVLVTQPGVSAAGLYYTDEAYDDLLQLLPTDETRGKRLPPGGGVAYNLTWMVHDFVPWRFDHVSVHGDGTAWVATTFSTDATAGWQPVGEGTELFDLLTAVLADGEAPGLIGDTTAASSPTTPAAEARPVTKTEWFSLSGWRWVVPGALLGLLVGGAAARVGRTQEDEPRRVLVEA
ncbi:hypothetical protein GCM10023339_25900 [Alloalcanivorax gelatiniphagus]